MHSPRSLEANKALISLLNVEVRNTHSVITCGNRPVGRIVHDHTVKDHVVDAQQRRVKLYQQGYFLAFDLHACLKLFFFPQYKTFLKIIFEVQ